MYYRINCIDRSLLVGILFGFLLIGGAGCSNSADQHPLGPCDPSYGGDGECPFEPGGADDAGGGSEEDASGGRQCLSANGVLPGWCLVDGECFSLEQISPLDPCDHCEPAQAVLLWSRRTDGAPCDFSGDGSDAGRCIGGRCVQMGCVCDEDSDCCDGCYPRNVGQQCGASSLPCVQVSCSQGGRCVQFIDDGWCLVDETCVENPHDDEEC